jgi:hypothetical protein
VQHRGAIELGQKVVGQIRQPIGAGGGADDVALGELLFKNLAKIHHRLGKLRIFQ